MCNIRTVLDDSKPRVSIDDEGRGDIFCVKCFSCGVYITHDVGEHSAEQIRTNHISWHAWFQDLEPILPLLPPCFCTGQMMLELCGPHADVEVRHRGAIADAYYSAIDAGEPDVHPAIQAYHSVLEDPGQWTTFDFNGHDDE
jgi:hypothetical protein